MAMNYQNFASLGVNLNRQKYGPLDISNVFTSAADLKYYLTKGTFTEGVSEYWYKSADEKVVPYPYEGQVLATVIDGVVEVFVLALDAEGNFETREIGAKVEVDGKTIKLNADGKLELVGIPADITGKTLVPSLVNGELTWAEPDTATAEGQAQEIEGLKTRATALEATVNGTGEGEDHVPGLVEKVAALEAVDNATQAELDAYKEVVTKAISDAVTEVKKYADDNDADTVYDDSDLQTRVKALEDEERYDDTEVRELIADLDEAIGDTEGGLVKDIADNKKAIADEKARAEAAEKALGERIDGIDFIDQGELDAALAPINTALGTKAAQSDLEALEGRVNAFLTGTGTEAALDSLQELIAYIDAHDGADLTELIATVNAIEGKLEGIDSTVVAYVTSAIDALKIGDYAKAADLTALAGRVKALEDADNATQDELDAYKTEVTNAIATAKSEAISDADGKLANKVNTSDFETFKGQNTTAIDTAKSEAIAAAKTETEGQIATHVEAADAKYATKDELSEAVEGIENDLLAYAKTADVNAELAKKIETGSIAHSSETLAEGVTVEGTKLSIVVDTYTKQEVRDYVADVIEDMTGGESAADVLLALNNHIDTYTEKVGQIDAKDAAQDTAIAAAKTQADKGVEDAAKVASDLDAAELLIAANAREIETVKGTITTVNETFSGKISSLENKDIELAGLITGLDTSVKGHGTTLAEHAGAIAALQTKDNDLAALIQGNTKKFEDYSTTEQMNKAIDDKIAAIPATDLSKHATIEYVDGELAKKADASSVYTKDEADTAFMTEGEVDARINALIVAADPEGGKTITDIQNLVKYVDENADDIAALITATGANTDKLVGIDTTVKGYVDSAIAALVMPKASTEVTIAEDGTLGLGQVSTDKLIQGTDTLVIDGGSAAV